MKHRTYRWDDVTEERLRRLDFAYSNGFSTEDCKAFVKSIPVYHYSETILLEARIVAYLDGEVRVDMMDSSSHSLYAAWYVEEDFSRYRFLEVIEKKLNNVLKRYGIKEIKEDGSKDKEVNRNSTHPHKRDTALSRV